ncbi:DDT domain-containing protein DDR4-like isoform X1 [Salvia hispanica]|uniref:DDT domain-containing protein DDR4-like isoform X1 n=1 Tax=Salvia hispanica TaxID=49212 RepID=UPI0020095C2B|nr:DDT domain-containing protein DDR4-like isoform X1 [Salvia hispanica]
MQALDLPCNPSLDPDPSALPEHYSPIHSPDLENNTQGKKSVKVNYVKSAHDNNGNSNVVVTRRERPSRACTQRAAAKLQAAAEAEAERKRKKKRREKLTASLLKNESEEDGYRDSDEEENGEEDGSTSPPQLQTSRAITPLLGEPEASQLPRWNTRSMWQLASILNFLNVFRPLLNVKMEFSAEEFETALIIPNNTLAEIHMPLLKAIPPVTRMALNHSTWITVLCRKLRDWWHWVAEGDLPIVASHGTEVEAYNTLDPGIRVVILKALCDIRVEQEDIRNHIDDSLKHGVQLSTFRKERLGGNSYGVSYWYEDDPIIGHRLYREIRNVEVKKGRGKNIPPIPHSSYQWEAVATNLDEFLNVSEKLFSSKNRTEVSVGKKLKNYMLPEIEKVHKRKEKLLKKQHRQALMLDNMINMDAIAAGRSLRDRKPVTYTFNDYDHSINEAIKVTKQNKQSPEHFDGGDPPMKHELSRNGRLDVTSQHSQNLTFSAVSPNSPYEDDDDDDDDDDGEFYEDHKTETLDRSDRQKQRPERYSVKDYVEAVSDIEADFDSDDDIVGEVVYDDEYLKRRKRRKMSSSSEGDEEYHWDEENHEEEEEEEEDDILSSSEDSDVPRHTKALPGRTRRETKLRSVGDLKSGLRRSKRATRNRINYKQYEMSESDNDQTKPEKSNVPNEPSYSSGGAEFSTGMQDSEEKISNQEDVHADQLIEMQQPEVVEEKPPIPPEQENHGDDDVEMVSQRGFLDLNELAPGSGCDDGPNSVKDDDRDGF